MPAIKHIIKAARLRTLPLSVSGIIVGSSLAYPKGRFELLIFVFAILTTLGFQILSNFANDYGDGKKGTDNEQRVGPQRAIQSGAISLKQMKQIIVVTTAITLFVALLLIYVSFGVEKPFYALFFFLLGLASIIAAVKYTIGAKAYGYSGFGDLFVLVFFGLLSVVGSYFLYTKQLDGLVFLPALSVGLLSVGVLHLNNMRDRKSDELSKKRTIAVKLGMLYSKVYYFVIIILSFVSAMLFAYIRGFFRWQYLFVISFLPIGFQLFRVLVNEDAKALDPELKTLALSTFLFAVLFALGQFL